MHGRKRRVLSQAFSDAALKGMEDVMLLHVRQLCAVLAGDGFEADVVQDQDQDRKGLVRNMGNWFSYLSYDVMGELCFGKSFDMLISDSRRHMIGLVDRAANRHYVVSLFPSVGHWDWFISNKREFKKKISVVFGCLWTAGTSIKSSFVASLKTAGISS